MEGVATNKIDTLILRESKIGQGEEGKKDLF